MYKIRLLWEGKYENKMFCEMIGSEKLQKQSI